MSLKDNWKHTGVGLGHAFRDLGKSVVKSVATGVKKVDNWANKEEEKPEQEEKEDSQIQYRVEEAPAEEWEVKEQPTAEWQAEESEPVKTVVKEQPREKGPVEWKAE